MIKIGSHVGLKGKEMFLGSVKEAISYNANCFMIYTGAPQNTRRKSIDEFNIDEGLKLMNLNNISIDDVIIHAPYIMNLANPEEEKRNFGIDFFTKEVKRTAEIGAKTIVLHPGAALKQDVNIAIEHIANGINKVIENTKDLDVVIALETMAGKGTEVGRNFDELSLIIDKIIDKSRIGVCFDTCHVNDSGYDLVNDYENVISEFDNKIGIDYIKVFHINDSKNEKGAMKDRHENLGQGFIGYETLIKVIYDDRFINIPKILETPYVSENDEEKKKTIPPYRHEIEAIRNKKYPDNIIELIRKK